MKLKVLTAFRPSTGGMQSGAGPLYQNAQFVWYQKQPPDKEIYQNDNLVVGQRLYQPDRMIELFTKNSVNQLEFLIVYDEDMTPHDGWLAQYPNVRTVKCPWVCDVTPYEPYYRNAAALQHGLTLCDDDDWVVFGPGADVVPCVQWDKNLEHAIATHGANNVFCPFWVECVGTGPQRTLDTSPYTADDIWVTWRQKICCHCLTIPHPAQNYLTTHMFEDWCTLARSGAPPYVVEPCGVRNYGYFACYIVQAKHLKEIPKRLGPGWETEIDNNLYALRGLMKVCMTDSFILHPAFIDFRP